MEKERRVSYHHLVVPAGTNVISDNGNVNDNGNAHEEVVDEHTVAAAELVEEQSITDIDENVTSLAGMPALHRPPPVNSKTKFNQAYESKLQERWNLGFMGLVESSNIALGRRDTVGLVALVAAAEVTAIPLPALGVVILLPVILVISTGVGTTQQAAGQYDSK
jgi:hypothetical protein